MKKIMQVKPQVGQIWLNSQDELVEIIGFRKEGKHKFFSAKKIETGKSYEGNLGWFEFYTPVKIRKSEIIRQQEDYIVCLENEVAELKAKVEHKDTKAQIKFTEEEMKEAEGLIKEHESTNAQSKPRYLNIDKLVDKIEINTTNLPNDAAKIREEIIKVIHAAVNDTYNVTIGSQPVSDSPEYELAQQLLRSKAENNTNSRNFLQGTQCDKQNQKILDLVVQNIRPHIQGNCSFCMQVSNQMFGEHFQLCSKVHSKSSLHLQQNDKKGQKLTDRF